MTVLSAKDARRILALWLPRLPADRLKRQQAHTGVTDNRPLVFVARVESAMRLSAIDAEAARLGLHAGMALADARAMIPALAVHDADESADAKLLARIADWCERFSPLVAFNSSHGVLLDVTGVTHLFGGEARMLAEIRRAIGAQGFTVHAALAGTSAAARALARYADGTVAEAGDEATAVALLPVAALDADEATHHGLRRAGLKTIGQVAARGRSELSSRFGRAFVVTLDRIMGKAEAPLSPRNPLPDCMAERHLAEPVIAEEAIAATILALAQSLSGLLEKRGLGARRIEAHFFRADGERRLIAIETARPTREAAMVARLFQEKLAALSDPLDPGFGFDLIRLGAGRTQPFVPQAASFDSHENDRIEIHFLIDRLAARFGADRILRFHPLETHIPEAAAVALPAQRSIPSKISWKVMRNAGEAPRRPLRLFARPEPIEVMAEVPDGPPLRFRWRRALHTVALAEGPERIAMEWWRNAVPLPTRDYFRIEDRHGRRFWLYRDGLYHRETPTPRWYMHGVFA